MKRKWYQVQKQSCAGTLAVLSGAYAFLTNAVLASASRKGSEAAIAMVYAGVACARKRVRRSLHHVYANVMYNCGWFLML